MYHNVETRKSKIEVAAILNLTYNAKEEKKLYFIKPKNGLIKGLEGGGEWGLPGP